MSRRALAPLTAALLAAGLLAPVVAGAQQAGEGTAGAFSVTSAADSGPGTYRQAIDDAEADGTDDVITFAAGLDITLASDVVYDATTALLLEGNGSTIHGAGNTILEAASAAEVVVTDLTFEGGGGTEGAAIAAGVADVGLTRTAFVDNIATGSLGGAVRAGQLDAIDSSFTGNTVEGEPGFGAGGAFWAGNATVDGSTFADNRAESSQGGGDGGAIAVDGTLEARNSTFTDNTAFAGGGGGISASTVSLTFVTMSENSAEEGADVDAFELVSDGTVFANPVGATSCSGVGTADSSYSYSTDSSCGLDDATDVEDGADPQLGALANNGGLTQTLLPAASSPLVNQIPEGTCTPWDTVDQRDEPRPGPDSTLCDIGAVERQPNDTPAPPEPPEPPTPPGEPGTSPIAARPSFTG